MPDMTMCLSDKCPKKPYCYRSTAKQSMRQSYTEFPFKSGPSGTICDYFVAMHDTKKSIQKTKSKY